MLQNIVRKRAFDYIEDGVQLSGSDVEEAKDVVDRIKVNHCNVSVLTSEDIYTTVDILPSFYICIYCKAGRPNLDAI